MLWSPGNSNTSCDICPPVEVKKPLKELRPGPTTLNRVEISETHTNNGLPEVKGK